jgi:hypothetical protein
MRMCGGRHTCGTRAQRGLQERQPAASSSARGGAGRWGAGDDGRAWRGQRGQGVRRDRQGGSGIGPGIRPTSAAGRAAAAGPPTSSTTRVGMRVILAALIRAVQLTPNSCSTTWRPTFKGHMGYMGYMGHMGCMGYTWV